MNRTYYLLPADYCKDALAKYQIAKDDAVSAKKEIMQKYGCTVLFRRGRLIDGLGFEKYTDLSGFTVPKRKQGYWFTAPKKNTIRGKQAAKEMEDCGDLLETWQWALEHSLGVYGVVRDRDGFHMLTAHPLDDGSVVLNAPAGKNPPRSANYSRNFDDPVIPECAKPISEAEAKLRLIYETEMQREAA